MKKIKLLLTSVLLLCSSYMSAYHFAVGGIYYQKHVSENSVYVTYRDVNYNSYSGEIIVPESVVYNDVTYKVIEIGSNAFSKCTNLTSVILPEGLTSIEDNAFWGCSSLTNIKLPTSVVEVGESVFSGCPEEIFEIVDGVKYNGTWAFGVSDKTQSEYCIKEGTSGLAPNTFLNCTKASRITIPNSVVTIGDYAFGGCISLTSITIPNSVTSIGNYSFKLCSSLRELYIEDGDKILQLGYNNLYNSSYNTGRAEGLFYDCSLNYLYLGRDLNYTLKGNGSTEYTGYSPFYGQKNLRSVDVGKKLNSFDEKWLFVECGEIATLTIPANILTIGSNILHYSTSVVKTIFLGNTKPNGAENIRGYVNYVSSVANYGFGKEYPNLSSMFEVGGVKYVLKNAKERTCDVIDCTYNLNDENIVIDNFVSYRNIKLTVNDIQPYALYNNDAIKNLVVNNKGDVKEKAFYGCDSLISAELGNQPDSIFNYVFAECTSLGKITIPDNISYIGDACFENNVSLEKAITGTGINMLNAKTFKGCSSLKDFKIGENVARICDEVFYGCCSLPKLSIPGATTRIDNSVFTDCKKLATVVIEDNNKGLTLGHDKATYNPMFYGCQLDSVYVGADLSFSISPFKGNEYLRSVTYNDKETMITDSEFYGCSNLQNIKFGNGISTIGNTAFANCVKLSNIVVPDLVTNLGRRSFYGCSALKTAKIGTGVKTLLWATFEGCKSLKDIQIGVNVDSIGKSVFRGCRSLTRINIPQATTTVSDSVFFNCTSLANVIIEDRTKVLNLGSNGQSNESSATNSTHPLFNSCPLDSVYIGGKIKYNTSKEYGFSPFFRNTSLRTVVVADSETEVYDNEFYGCTGLTDVVVGDGVTKIGNWAFSGCVGLLNFSFGASVETIGTEAFSDCTSMVKLVSSCNVPPVCGKQALADINIWDCTLYVPNEYIDDYYMADQWCDFFFIDGAEYKVTFTIGDETYAEKMVKYGEIIELPIPTKNGYTFVGWEDVPETMPARDIVINGSFSANVYTITYLVDDEVYNTTQVACDDSIIPIVAPEKYDYVFARWEGLPEIMPAHDVTVTAVYTEKVKEVSITINQYGSGTYCSDYALDFSEVEGLKAYAATGFNKMTQYITLTRVMTAEAEVGLFIKGEPGTYIVPVIDESDDRSLNMLVATPIKTTVNSTSEGGEYSNFKYTIKSGENTPMFYQFADGSTLSAGKAYLQIPTDWLIVSNQRTIKIEFDEGESTDINEVKSEDEATVVYDLVGRPVTAPSKGVYIVNGKKVYIK